MMASNDRLLSLDVMRGVTILAMILVNNPGTWSALYWPLGHADWHGWTPTDLIFPFFVFMVGVAMAFSFAKYVSGDNQPTAAIWIRIGRRVAVLILLGLLLNGAGKLFGWMLGYADDAGLDTLRFPGVLQRIALAYLGASVLVLLVGRRGQVAAAVALLVGYGAMLALLPSDVPTDERLGQEANVVRMVDRALIGQEHMWSARPTDPEGLLSTLPAIVTAMIGYWTGRFIRAGVSPARVGCLLLVGVGVAIVGQLAGWYVQPINKALWTPTFVLLTGGLGMAALAVCLAVFDLMGREQPVVKSFGEAFAAVGANSIFAFVGASLVASLLSVVRVGDQTVKAWAYENWFAGPLAGAGDKFSSLCYALAYVACWWLVLLLMRRLGWTVRV